MPRGKPFEKGSDPRRNAGGQRNKAAVAFARSLRELLVAEGNKTKAVIDPKTGKKVARKKVEWMVQAVWSEALQGREWAVSFIAERVEGKVSQPNTNLNLDLSSLTMEQLERISKGEDVTTVLATSSPSGD